MLWKEHRVQTIVYSCLSSQGTTFPSSNYLRLSVHPTILRVAIQRELRNWCLLLQVQALPIRADEDFILSEAGVGDSKQPPLHPGQQCPAYALLGALSPAILSW